MPNTPPVKKWNCSLMELSRLNDAYIDAITSNDWDAARDVDALRRMCISILRERGFSVS